MRLRHAVAINSKIIFEVTEAEEGGCCVSALGYGINTQGETLEELRAMVREAVDCYFDTPEQAPKIIRLHVVRDEVAGAMKTPRDLSGRNWQRRCESSATS